ncbi:hypothetical protein Tco_1255614 [Tanacetum coccineum]
MLTLIELTASMIEARSINEGMTQFLFEKEMVEGLCDFNPNPCHRLEASWALPQKRKKSKTQTTSLVHAVSNHPRRKSQRRTLIKPSQCPRAKGALVPILRPLLGDSEDELKDDSDEEMLEAGEELDEEFL